MLLVLASLDSLACWTEMPELSIHLANLLCLNFTFFFLSFFNLQSIVFTLLAGLDSLACWTEMPELLMHLANRLYLKSTLFFFFLSFFVAVFFLSLFSLFFLLSFYNLHSIAFTLLACFDSFRKPFLFEFHNFCFLFFFNIHSIVFILLADLDSLACWTEIPELLIHLADLLYLNLNWPPLTPPPPPQSLFSKPSLFFIYTLSFLLYWLVWIHWRMDRNSRTLDSFSKPLFEIQFFLLFTLSFLPFGWTLKQHNKDSSIKSR